MTGTVTTLPPSAIRETAKMLRDLAKRMEQGASPPIMVATANEDGSKIDARCHNISPTGMLVAVCFLLELTRTKASATLGNPDADPGMRREDTRALVFANTALDALKPYAPKVG